MLGRAVLLALVVATPLCAADADHRSEIEKAARRHGLPAELVQAMVWVESGNRSDAVSPKGAQGLLQLMPGTAEELGVDEALDVRQNLDGGCRYLRRLWKRYGDVALVLAAYNAGTGAVDAAGGIPRFEETREYVSRVIGLCRRIRERMAEEKEKGDGQ